MAADDKARLVQLLEETRSETRAALDGVDLEMVIDPGSGWRVRDVVAHMAAWDREAVTALQAHSKDEIYRIPGYTSMDAFNARNVEERKALTAEQVCSEWETAHTDLKLAVEEVPPDRFGERLAYPWGGYGSVSSLVEIMAHHERGHRQDILEALQG